MPDVRSTYRTTTIPYGRRAKLVVWARSLMAVVAEGPRKGAFIWKQTTEMEDLAAQCADPTLEAWKMNITRTTREISKPPNYGLTTLATSSLPGNLWRSRPFSDLVMEVAAERVRQDALTIGMGDVDQGLDVGGGRCESLLRKQITVYLAFAFSG